ncbi:MAG TPA: ATP-binding cassette domain-containing protein [Candidatus Scubalenecus merdavium]|uniref:ATP-binding cassette domain-containing protein n=1 Tax=Candidatus Scybalenecus merdavium TaxID=2840939 RepID=A0A9D1MUZ7_9FIRM|nr:ATP-binding cassette domain-containing protein [Candidatus Scubalenecus merdavium]
MLQLENITKLFNKGTVDESTVFDNFNLSVSKGEFVSLIGSNGSGKTTLLNLICGSLKADGGRILFQGKDITNLSEYKRARSIGRVFQDPKAGTCPNLTILENLALADNKNKPFGLGKCVSKKRIDYFKTLLEKTNMGLENRLNVQVGTLSGGQRQALALVIANMSDIDLLILDEHTAALDPKSSETIMQLTDRFIQESSITTIMVTHNLRFAVEYGSRLIMLHEGKSVVDLSGADKANANVDDLLKVFNEISIESGN